MDGPPFVMSATLIEANPDEYDWIALVPGLGHLYMNQIKTFFKAILLEPLAHVLNFKTPKAIQVPNT